MRPVALAIAMLLSTPAWASPEENWRSTLLTRNDVTNAAFNPNAFFPERQGFEDEVLITYVADDWRWPFWSIAIRRGRLDRERGSLMGECANRWTARMVRAPGTDTDRPRQRALAMVSRIHAARQANADAILPDLLDADGLHWLEARIDRCPGATEVLMSTDGLSWSRFANIAPPSTDGSVRVPPPFLHADHVRVAFHTLHTEASYDGPILAGTPAEWATTLYETLSPCWRPTTTDAPPWRTN